MEYSVDSSQVTKSKEVTMKHICFVLGTRPEIIKLAPVIRVCQRKRIPFTIIHTNQHFSPSMDQIFFKELRLPKADFNLNIHESLHGKMVGKMLEAIEQVLLDTKPQLVLVQGDTNTVLAGALAAAKLMIPVGHVEAGLRSYDRTMPEEINRVITDHLSTYLFCPTKKQKDILLEEGIKNAQITVTGNTIVDSINQNMKLAELNTNLSHYSEEKYMLLTLHRPSNVDDPQHLKEIVEGLYAVSEKLGYPIYFPIHPRTKLALQHARIILNPAYINILPPVQYLEMLMLERYAQLIMTDSGGVQEEACILKMPCITLRDNTERPETVEVGGNLVSGTTKQGILKAAKQMINKPRTWENPFGDGHASEKIIQRCASKN